MTFVNFYFNSTAQMRKTLSDLGLYLIFKKMFTIVYLGKFDLYILTPRFNIYAHIVKKKKI